MTQQRSVGTSPFSARLMGILIGIGLFAFVAVFALIGWAPDLASRDRAGSHPYSSSALGYGGLVKLLEADGQTVNVSRLASSLDYAEGLLVVTIPEYGLARAPDGFDQSYISEPALYVLPKWRGRIDPSKRQWQSDTDLLDKGRVTGILSNFDDDAKVWRLRNPGTFSTPFGRQRPRFENNMQVIESNSLEAVISLPGGALVSKLPGSDIYILSDPDVLNTFGLANRENAMFTLDLLDWLKYYEESPITFDATLHGFERSDSLMKAIFDIPFLGATILAIATILMIGWAAFVRFGPPERETRVIAFGKKALVESSAGLVSMARRENQMAPGYLHMTARAMRKRLGLPRGLPEADLANTLDAIAKQKELTTNWSQLTSTLASSAHSRDDLTDKASAIWRWRKEMTDEH